MNSTDTYLSDASHREMAAGVLKQAKQDLRRFRKGTSKIRQELFLDAYRWVTANDFAWPFSFLNVCRLLNLEPESVRQELMSDLSLGTFAYWARRCGRATRRLSLCFSRLFVGHSIDEPRERIFQDTAASTIPI